MAPLPLTRLARVVLALLLAVGSVITAEAESVPRATLTQTSNEDQDDDRDSELVVPTAPRYTTRPKRSRERLACVPRLTGAADFRALSRLGFRTTSRDPLGSRLRC